MLKDFSSQLQILPNENVREDIEGGVILDADDTDIFSSVEIVTPSVYQERVRASAPPDNWPDKVYSLQFGFLDFCCCS
jgi:hypothetical protein